MQLPLRWSLLLRSPDPQSPFRAPIPGGGERPSAHEARCLPPPWIRCHLPPGVLRRVRRLRGIQPGLRRAATAERTRDRFPPKCPSARRPTDFCREESLSPPEPASSPKLGRTCGQSMKRATEHVNRVGARSPLRKTVTLTVDSGGRDRSEPVAGRYGPSSKP